ncbi:MAG TPA: hypothetical protein DEB06_07985 [Phycisphaerales bacterium]|nr:hypothetical protein [Phycisphaerales bacterium]
MPARSLLVVLCSLAILLAPATRAWGQSDLEKENAELKARVTKLEADLALAVERIKALSEENSRLRKMAGQPAKKPDGPGAGGAAPGPGRSSPASILALLKAEYAAKLAPLPRDSKADQLKFQREAAQWAAEAEKAHSGDVRWHIRLSGPPQTSPRGTALTGDLLDAPGGTVIEPGVDLIVPSRFGRSITLEPAQKEWTLAGTVRVQPRIDMKRADDASGAPGSAPLVGPFVEFRYEFNATEVTKPEPAKKP